MSISQLQRNLNQLNKEIASSEKKMSELTKKEADKTKKIGAIQKGITKNTSMTMLNNKNRQIEGLRKDLSNILAEKAKVNKRIADSRNKLSQTTIKLQKAEANQAKAKEKEQSSLYTAYEQQIADLSKQIDLQETKNANDEIVFDSNEEEEYDIFVSHATEDKESFCDEFVEILQEEYNLKIWYDSLSLKWGDNIRTEIDKGLRKSKFGIVVLSKSYIKKYWTNYELEGLFQRETTGGKLILPIWHDITKQQVQDFSFSLAGKMAMNTAIMTPNEIAKKMNELFEVS